MDLHSYGLWREVMRTVSEGIFMVNERGRICEVNEALCSLTGYTREEFIGQPCSIFKCDSCATMRGESLKSWCHLFEHKLMVRRCCHISLKDGTRIPVLKNARLLLAESAQGQPSAADNQDIFSIETITDIREIIEKDTYIHRVENILKPEASFEGIVGSSAPMQRVYEMLCQAAQSSAPVLILGESGTGKELAAKALHNQSARRNFPFVDLNCAALNEHVLESELFGHVKGAFTGAGKDRAGRFEAAHTGTLFLDEIGDIPLSMQVKILRVLETGTLARVGENTSRTVDVRIVSATNKDLPELIEHRLFREDLAFRINVIPIRIPPLRERVEDIPLLIAHFIKIMQEFSGSLAQTLSPELMRLFMMYSWPGNVRQLRNVLEYGAVMARGQVIDVAHVPDYVVQGLREVADSSWVPATPVSKIKTGAPSSRGKGRPSGNGLPLIAPFSAEQERQCQEITKALHTTGGNVSKAAGLIGVHRTTLINRMLRLGLKIQKSL